MRLRRLSPAGAPIRVGDLARWAAVVASTRDARSRLEGAIGARFNVPHAFVTCTGRAGMTVLLKALSRTAAPTRNEVVIPSYTCFSVAASVVKAGLRPRLLDVSPETLDYAADALHTADFSRVLAIVATNLYGLPSDLPALGRLAREKGVFLIDDAAQAMGASIAGRSTGTWGDAGLFSFDKGKTISAIDGGVIVTGSDQIAAALRQELAAIGEPGLGEAAIGVTKALVYFAFLRPWLYWIPGSIPQLGLGTTEFDTGFPLRRPSAALASLAVTMLDRLEDLSETRSARAAEYLRLVADLPGIRGITPLHGAIPAYPRLPLLLESTRARDRALVELNARGIGATGSYPTSLADVPALRGITAGVSGVPGGRHVASHILTLPTHPFVTSSDVERAVSVLGGTVRRSPDGNRPDLHALKLESYEH